MNKRQIAWTAIVIGVIIGVIGFVWAFFVPHEITLTQATLQQKIDAKMPHTAKGVTISNVQLELTDKIGISVHADATKLNTHFKLDGNTVGDLRYDNNAGSFYFHPRSLKISNVQVNDSSLKEKASGAMDKAGDAADKAGGAVEEIVKGEKVNSLLKKVIDPQKILDKKDQLLNKKDEALANKEQILAKGQEVCESMVQKTAEAVLARVPVYTLPDDLKGTVVRCVLKEVEVKDGTVIAHLSLWQLTKTVIGFAFTFVLAVVFAATLLLNPKWGLPDVLSLL